MLYKNDQWTCEVGKHRIELNFWIEISALEKLVYIRNMTQHISDFTWNNRLKSPLRKIYNYNNKTFWLPTATLLHY